MARDRDSRGELVQTMAKLLRDQGFAATGRAQLLVESGVSNGSLYHHFPGGMEELAEAALEASGAAVAEALRESLQSAADTATGIARFLEIAKGPQGAVCLGCPIAPTALESSIISPRLRAAAARCFAQWESLIAERLRAEAWPEPSVDGTASAVLSLVEGALLLARVSTDSGHLDHAEDAVRALLTRALDRRSSRARPSS